MNSEDMRLNFLQCFLNFYPNTDRDMVYILHCSTWVDFYKVSGKCRELVRLASFLTKVGTYLCNQTTFDQYSTYSCTCRFP